jgi:class 3 adenylate cyclase
VLICNAAILGGPRSRLENLDWAAWRRALEVNLIGTMRVAVKLWRTWPRVGKKDRRHAMYNASTGENASAAVTVLFADIVGFTQLSERLSPSDVVAVLDSLFTRWEALASHGVEKIKTIGGRLHGGRRHSGSAAGPRRGHRRDGACDAAGGSAERGDGASAHPDSLTHAFTRIPKSVGLDGVRLHDCRHGVATALAKAMSAPGGDERAHGPQQRDLHAADLHVPRC